MSAVFELHLLTRKGKNIISQYPGDAQQIWAALQDKYAGDVTRDLTATNIRNSLQTFALDDG